MNYPQAGGTQPWQRVSALAELMLRIEDRSCFSCALYHALCHAEACCRRRATCYALLCFAPAVTPTRSCRVASPPCTAATRPSHACGARRRAGPPSLMARWATAAGLRAAGRFPGLRRGRRGARRASSCGQCRRVKKLERFVEGAFCVRIFALPTACRPCRRQPILRWTGIIGVGALTGKEERARSARAWLFPLILTSGAL